MAESGDMAQTHSSEPISMKFAEYVASVRRSVNSKRKIKNFIPGTSRCHRLNHHQQAGGTLMAVEGVPETNFQIFFWKFVFGHLKVSHAKFYQNPFRAVVFRPPFNGP